MKNRISWCVNKPNRHPAATVNQPAAAHHHHHNQDPRNYASRPAYSHQGRGTITHARGAADAFGHRERLGWDSQEESWFLSAAELRDDIICTADRLGQLLGQ